MGDRALLLVGLAGIGAAANLLPWALAARSWGFAAVALVGGTWSAAALVTTARRLIRR